MWLDLEESSIVRWLTTFNESSAMDEVIELTVDMVLGWNDQNMFGYLHREEGVRGIGYWSPYTMHEW
jgi:hypothetical protein